MIHMVDCLATFSPVPGFMVSLCRKIDWVSWSEGVVPGSAWEIALLQSSASTFLSGTACKAVGSQAEPGIAPGFMRSPLCRTEAVKAFVGRLPITNTENASRTATCFWLASLHLSQDVSTSVNR